jgi:hypothetical protein
MTEEDIGLLKQRDHQLVRLHPIDGEIVTARVLFVSETEQDVIVDMISTTDASRYPKDDVQPKFQYEFKDIASVEPFLD